MLAMNKSLLSVGRTLSWQRHAKVFVEGYGRSFHSAKTNALVSAARRATATTTTLGQQQQQWDRQSGRPPLHEQFSIRFFHSTSSSNRREKEKDTKTTLASRSTDSSEEKPPQTKPGFPTIQSAKQLPLVYRDMDNTSLVMLGGLGEHAARQEILIRHIMAVDEVEYERAMLTFYKIEEANHQGKYLLGLPFQIWATALVTSGLVSVPMVFHLHTVETFNELFVTADVPPPKDLETWLEVGAWSWNWMEPLLGTASFILLCMQYFRINMDHLGIKPYTKRLKNFRAQRLAAQFPRYDREVLMKYSESSTIYKS